MSLLRTSTGPVRRAAMPALRPSTMAVRGYADKPDGEFSDAYRRGQASGFSKREQVRRSRGCMQCGHTVERILIIVLPFPVYKGQRRPLCAAAGAGQAEGS